MSVPFERHSLSFRLYPHDLAPPEALDEMAAQASLAISAGFDGVMVSERHGGIVGNVPNPVQVIGWLAGAMASGWVAPCPVLALIRRSPQIVEDVAWLGARFPGRVGVGLGAGGNPLDFELYDEEPTEIPARFEAALRFVAAHLSGRADDPLAGDLAVRRCVDHPIPVLSAAMSRTAATRAARCGVGTIGSSLLSLEQERAISDAYRAAGGSGPQMLIRFIWLGQPPREAIDAKFSEYQRSSERAGRSLAGQRGIITGDDPVAIAEELVAAVRRTATTCLHLRVHVPGVGPEQARAQIEAVGDSILPRVRRALSTVA